MPTGAGLPAETIRANACRIISCMAALPEPSLILSFEEARHLVEDHAARLHPRGKELVELLEGAGQILAEPVLADRNFPPFPRAMRDGYAVRAADLLATSRNARRDRRNQGRRRTGCLPSSAAGPGRRHHDRRARAARRRCCRDGRTHLASMADRVQIMKAVAAGDNIAPDGSEAKRGERLLSPGLRLDYAAIAVAASTGRSRLLVYSKPKSRCSPPATKSSTLTFRPQPTRSAIRTAIRWPRRCRRRAESQCCCPSLPTNR